MGETGHTWLANLRQQIAELERRWAIEVEQLARRGSEAFRRRGAHQWRARRHSEDCDSGHRPDASGVGY